MFCRRSREDLDSRIRRAEQAVQAVRLAWPRREPYFRRSRISQEPGASYSGKVCVVCVRGGRGKCLRFVEIWFTFPGKNSENGGISIFSRGKCRRFVEIWFTFPHQSKKKMQEIATTESIRMTIIVFPLTVTQPRSM